MEKPAKKHDIDGFTAPNWRRPALITVDVQNDTLDGQPLEVAGTTAILPAMRRALELFRASGLPTL